MKILSSAIRVSLVLVWGLSFLGHLQRIDLPFSRALYLHELVMVFVVVLASIRLGKRRFPSVSSMPVRITILLVAWIIGGIIFQSGSVEEMISPLLYLARVGLYGIFAYQLARLAGERVVAKQHLQTGMITWIISFSILGLLQYMFIPDTRFLRFLGWDDHYLRLIGTLFDPGFTGAILCLSLLLVQSRLLQLSHWVRGLTLMLAGAALLFTYSRASFVAYVIGCILLLLSRRQRLHGAILVFFVLAIPLLPRARSEGTRLERTASATARITSVSTTLATLKPAEYMWGKGWYLYRPLSQSQNTKEGVVVPNHASAPDNSLVFVLASLGIPGLVLVLILGGMLLRSYPREVWILVIAWLVTSLFANTLVYPFLLLYMGTVMAYTRR